MKTTKLVKILEELGVEADLKERIITQATPQQRNWRKYAIYLTKQQEVEIRELLPTVKLVLWNPSKNS